MSHAPTPAELDAYRKHGYFARERVFGPDELEPLRDAVERVHAAIDAARARGDAPVEYVDDRRYQHLLGSVVKWEWQGGAHAIRSMEPFAHLDPRLEALIDDLRLVVPARALVGDESLSLFTDKLNFKRPGGAPFPWHQDTPYWAFGCDHLDRLASLELFLDDATLENGCLWLIPGSQRHGVLPCFEDRGTLGRLYTDLRRLPPGAAGDPVPLEAPAGSVLFFDGAVVHGSRRNRSASSRRAIVLTYQPAGHPRWNRADVRSAGA